MYDKVIWNNDEKDAKRFRESDFETIRAYGTIDKYYVPIQ